MMLPNGEITISSMTPADLRNLIQTGEGMYLEFKKTTPSVEKIAREISAFANSKGGTILIGVDDHKNITGISAYFEEEYLLHKAAYECCVPAVKIEIELIHSGNQDVMVVRVPEAEQNPFTIRARRNGWFLSAAMIKAFWQVMNKQRFSKTGIQKKVLRLNMVSVNRCCSVI